MRLRVFHCWLPEAEMRRYRVRSRGRRFRRPRRPGRGLRPVVRRGAEQLGDDASGQQSGDLFGELVGRMGFDPIKDLPHDLADLRLRMATRRWVNPALMSLRSRRCRGRSVKMRLPVCAGFAIVGSGMVMPLAEQNIAGLLDTKRMSSYFNRAQNFVTSFQHTGDVARSSRYAE